MMPNDGTILARFTYETSGEEDAPLLALARFLDPGKKFAQWDASNRLRYTTVTIAICVIDTEQMKEKMPMIQAILDETSKKLMALEEIIIHKFHFINEYHKRTFSLKHVSMCAEIGADYICKI